MILRREEVLVILLWQETCPSYLFEMPKKKNPRYQRQFVDITVSLFSFYRRGKIRSALTIRTHGGTRLNTLRHTIKTTLSIQSNISRGKKASAYVCV